MISYLKFTKNNAKDAWKEEKSVQNAILLSLKIINCYKCKECEKIWLKPVNRLIKKFPSVYQFCYVDINKFVLLLKKGVYLNENMDSWERFDETSLPDQEAFRSELNLEDITEEDYAHGQKVWKKFVIKNLGEYHDLYVQSDTLLLADVFESFRNKCIEIYELNPAHFLSAPGLVWQACLKKTEVELELLTDFDMLLMVEKGIQGRICHVIHRYAKASNKHMTSYDKNIIAHVFRCKQFAWTSNVSKTSCKRF